VHILLHVKKIGTLSVSSDSEFVEEIYKKFENDENVLLYINGNSFFAESKNKRCLIERYPITLKQNKRFNSLDFQEKVAYMQDEVEVISDKINTVNIGKQNMFSDLSVVSSYSASVLSDLEMVKCNISNFVKQEYNNCWAASVATIVNYKKSKTLTAGDVSKAMGMSWYLGGTVANVRDALKHYGLSYTIKQGKPISWVKLKSDIDRNRPFCLGFVCSDNSHMVTGYGYAEAKKNKYVAIWDSNGYQRLLTYDGSSSQITMNGYTYIWKDTVY